MCSKTHNSGANETKSPPFFFLQAVVVLIICSFVATPVGFSQEIAEVVRSTGTIPRGHYKTWSLFLVCNPSWLTPAKSADLYSLYGLFQNFGRTIGDDHLAVWFWKETRPTSDPNLAADVDVERAVRICKALHLKPSASPHILITSSYPDENNLPRDFAVFELGQMSSSEISSLLTKLNDQLVVQGKVQVDEPQEHLWIRLLAAAQQTIGSFGCAWSLKIETGFLNADLHPCQSH